MAGASSIFDLVATGVKAGRDRLTGSAATAVGVGSALAPEEAEAGPLLKGATRLLDARFSNPVEASNPRKGVLAKTETVPTGIDQRAMDMGGDLDIYDFEGHPYILTQSDRSAAGGILNSINDKNIDPVNLRGGRDFMFDPESEGQVWASFPSVVEGLHGRAGELKRQTGKNPLLLPYAMAPTGIDFATMPLDAMINYARQGMSKTNIKKLDSKIKKVMPDWLGVMDPKSNAQFRDVVGDTRKAVSKIIDLQFRDVEGGLSVGEARAATSAADQYQIPDGSLRNVGIIDPSKPVLSDSGHPTYVGGLQGEGLGRFTDSMNGRAFAEANGRVIKNEPNDIRALSMNHDLQQGVIDEKLLRFIEKHKKKLGTAGILTAGGANASDAEASLLGMASKFGRNSEDMLGMAKKMENEGVDSDDIWQMTGWEKNAADGEWRTELSTSKTEIKIPKEGTFPLSEVIDNPDLMNAYDDTDSMPMFDLYDESVQGSRMNKPLTKMDVTFDPEIKSGEGEVVGNNIIVGTKGYDEKAIRDAILHETQHGIQDREGWARGGSPEEFEKAAGAYNKAYLSNNKRIRQKIDDIEKKPRIDRTITEMEELEELKEFEYRMERYNDESYQNTSSPYEMYQNMVGEVEARNAARRDAIGRERGDEVLRQDSPSLTEIENEPVRHRDRQIRRFQGDDSGGSYLKATEQKTTYGLGKKAYAKVMSESKARKKMTRRERRENPPSAALRKFNRAQLLPALGSMVQGAVRGSAETFDMLNPARRLSPRRNDQAQRFVSSVTQPMLFDENDPKAKKKKETAMFAGSLFGL